MTAHAPLPAVLVTGGAGRLGRLVVEALRARGTRTISLSRATAGSEADNLAVDLTDGDAVRPALVGIPVHTVVHLASAVHRAEAPELDAQIDATIASIVREKQPQHVVFSSTGAVYGDRNRCALTEDSPTGGESSYVRAKLASESALRGLAEAVPGTSVTVLRIFNVSGPDFPTSLVQRLITARPHSPVKLMNPDEFVRDYIHQSDVVRVLLAAVDRPGRGFRIFNVGAGAAVSTSMLLAGLEIPAESWSEVEGEASVNWSDNSAMVNEFEVHPRVMPTRAWASANL